MRQRGVLAVGPDGRTRLSPGPRGCPTSATPCAAPGVDVLLLSLGADLPWLTGYEAMPLERITMLVLPVDDEATLVVPALEAPRVAHDSRLFALRPWRETEDPVSIIAALVGGRKRLAVSDRAWSVHLLALQAELPGATFGPGERGHLVTALGEGRRRDRRAAGGRRGRRPSCRRLAGR